MASFDYVMRKEPFMKKLIELLRALPYEYSVLAFSIALTVLIVITAK
jgi:hypothetical protein